ncbi:hypothetical protein P7K49_000237 [Saguinus oedipus]|uniref:Uncharacterized protein n=1 Tax=Saguinus oedipus TaxID=9490 RepID=A0ABQ9WBX1_SAGOE|nr:hypothetical protein P7K49_000237 [Saguinus oedipus]
MINWNRLFPPLRQRQNVNYQGGQQSEPAVPPPLEVSEEQFEEGVIWAGGECIMVACFGCSYTSYIQETNEIDFLTSANSSPLRDDTPAPFKNMPRRRLRYKARECQAT